MGRRDGRHLVAGISAEDGGGRAAGAKITEVVTGPVGRKPLASNRLWQCRNDSWSSLEEACTQLVLAGTQCRPTDPPAETISGLLDALGPIERHLSGRVSAQPVLDVRRCPVAGDQGQTAGITAGEQVVSATFVTPYPPGKVISVANFPTTGGRHLGLTVRTSGSSVTLTLTGQQPSGPVLFQLPAFAGNIAGSSAGTVDEKTGTVTLAPTVRTVTVQLAHPAS